MTLGDLERVSAALNERIERMADASQADIDTLTQELKQVSADLQFAQQSLQAEIDQLAQANPGVDVSGLKAAADALDPAVQQLAGLKPSGSAPSSGGGS